MTLVIQDPKSPEGSSLQEYILKACLKAVRGGGAFAFVSEKGAQLLLSDEDFKSFTSTGAFDLVVGIDEITNVKALAALDEIAGFSKGLSVRVFHHDINSATFHPKFCWFHHGDCGYLITGSGNMTVRGLRGNWEAFTVSVLSVDEINSVEQQWLAWTKSNIDFLKSPDNQEVVERAMLNIAPIKTSTSVSPKNVSPQKTHLDSAETDDVVAPLRSLTLPQVLVAEIPKGDRWKQANFDIETFRNYFGIEKDVKEQRVILQHVSQTGSLGKLEIRPGVSVKSNNHRIELDAAAGITYPSEGRPIGVFVRVATRMFRYRLLMPDDPEYTSVIALLDSMWNRKRKRRDQLRRLVTDASILAQYWSNSHLWDAS